MIVIVMILLMIKDDRDNIMIIIITIMMPSAIWDPFFAASLRWLPWHTLGEIGIAWQHAACSVWQASLEPEAGA